jgi:hypothetical protein
VPLALLALAAWAYGRRSGGARGVLALAVGLAGVATGIEAAHYTRTLGPSGDDFTGLLALAAGIVLLGLGAVTLVRTRRRRGNLLWRGTRRGLLAAGGLLATMLVVLPLAIGYVSVHVGRAVVPAPHLGAAHEDVAFTTADGLRLHGWYVPSRNGAAVIAFPGRKGPQPHARMLSRHGYGVLLFDRRGEGESDGDPTSWGWGNENDLKAAIAFLQRRPDVDRERIGGLGLSVGGEMMIQTATETKVAPRPLLLMYSGHGQGGEVELNPVFFRAAREPKALWEIPGAAHMGGIRAQPREYERRVVGFFDGALL